MLPLLKSDIYDIFASVADSRPCSLPEWKDAVSLGVVLASKGYPGSYEKGFEIEGLDYVDARVIHMGTKASGEHIVTAGGRVLMVVAEGADISSAREKVYGEIVKIRCSNLFCRSDIAHIALEG